VCSVCVVCVRVCCWCVFERPGRKQDREPARREMCVCVLVVCVCVCVVGGGKESEREASSCLEEGAYVVCLCGVCVCVGVAVFVLCVCGCVCVVGGGTESEREKKAARSVLSVECCVVCVCVYVCVCVLWGEKRGRGSVFHWQLGIVSVKTYIFEFWKGGKESGRK
jgi:hypothetical protein